MTFFLISKKGSSKLLPLLGRMGGFGLLRITLLIFIYLMLHSMIFFVCGLADKFSKARRHAYDIPNLKIPLDSIYAGKSILYNIIRDEFYRILEGGNLHCRLESNHLLPDCQVSALRIF